MSGHLNYPKRAVTPFIACALLSVFNSCAQDEPAPLERVESCAPSSLPKVAGTTGQASVFSPDPIISSLNSNLSPSSSSLDSFAQDVQLDRLTGYGVLQGEFVDIRNLIDCDGAYGAYSSTQDFRIDHSDPAFQEANAYYASDQYLSMLSQANAIQPEEQFTIFAHCIEEDNAFYVRGYDETGATTHSVCLGNSVTTPGAFYADDSMVSVHEIQHGVLANAYHPTIEFNQFFFDFAGSANEAIADFMALMQYEEETPALLDPRMFSRWALGTFEAGTNSARGAHFCPMYDTRFNSGCTGTAGLTLTSVDYTFPVGLGWPFSNSVYSNIQQAYANYLGIEQIHNAGIVLTGALFDAYLAVADAAGGNQHAAKLFMTKLMMDTIAELGSTHLPSNDSLSPVTFMAITDTMVDLATTSNATYAAAIESAFAARGFASGASSIPNTWLVAPQGAAACSTDALSSNALCTARVRRKSDTLRHWMSDMGGNATIPSNTAQTRAASGSLHPGEIAVIWFNLGNALQPTVGEVEVTVSISNPSVNILGNTYNIGSMNSVGSTQYAQVHYLKVYGTDTASSGLNHLIDVDSNSATSEGVYFRSNPKFDNESIGYLTGIWVQTTSSASGTARFKVRAKASNSTTQPTGIDFDVPISL